MTPDDPRHGTNAGHVAGCRLECCRRAKSRYDKTRRWELLSTGQRRVVPVYRVIRRVQALQALGWSAPQIAEVAGLPAKSLHDFGRSPQVTTTTFRAIDVAYRKLQATPAVSRLAGRNRRYAASQGWPPPLAWDNIDDPDEQPTGWQYRPATRLELLEDLVERRTGISEACRALKVSRETLQKWCGSNNVHHLYRALAVREVMAANQHVDREQVAS